MKKTSNGVRKFAQGGTGPKSNMTSGPPRVSLTGGGDGSGLGSQSSSVRDAIRNAVDTRSDFQRFADQAKRLVNIPVGNNAVVKLGGGLSNPKLTYTKKFQKGGVAKKSARPAKKSGGRSCW